MSDFLVYVSTRAEWEVYMPTLGARTYPEVPWTTHCRP